MTASDISAIAADREKAVFLAPSKWYERPGIVYAAVAVIVACAIVAVVCWP